MKFNIILLKTSLFLLPCLQIGYNEKEKIYWLNLGFLSFMITLGIQTK